MSFRLLLAIVFAAFAGCAPANAWAQTADDLFAKLGLLLDFDRFAAGRRFLGLAALVLDNAWQDPSFVRESVTMALFARMGQPAPRESYARLFINGTY
jgi:spore coat protein CotH